MQGNQARPAVQSFDHMQIFLFYRNLYWIWDILQALAQGAVPSSIYGAEHLLRLFVQLPKLVPLGSVSSEAQGIMEVRGVFHKNSQKTSLTV